MTRHNGSEKAIKTEGIDAKAKYGTPRKACKNTVQLFKFKYENLYIGIPLTILIMGTIIAFTIIFSNQHNTIAPKPRMIIVIWLATYLLFYYFFLCKFIEFDATAQISDYKLNLQFRFSKRTINLPDIEKVIYRGESIVFTFKNGNTRMRIFKPLRLRKFSNLLELATLLNDEIAK